MLAEMILATGPARVAITTVASAQRMGTTARSVDAKICVSLIGAFSIFCVEN